MSLSLVLLHFRTVIGAKSSIRVSVSALLLLTLFLGISLAGHAQGCTQCLDSTRATPPAVQAAYRHAILLLIGVASALFVAALVLLRRQG